MNRTRGNTTYRYVTIAGVAALALAVWAQAAGAQPPAVPPADEPGERIVLMPAAVPSKSGQPTLTSTGDVVQAVGADVGEGGIEQVGCSSCGSGTMTTPKWYRQNGGHHCGSCGIGGCYPGRYCDPYQSSSACGRFFACLYNCACCPDPCYEPEWIPAANASFFADSARPVTQMRLRADLGFGFKNPDRSEYFWARVNTNATNPNTQRPSKTVVPGGVEVGMPFDDNNSSCERTSIAKGLVCPLGVRSVDYYEFSYYQEVAVGAFSAFVEMPYRRVDPDDCCGYSGFADMNVGTKSLLLDCELVQIAFQFKTYIPIGIADKGLGTGHVSLEPSLLWTLRVTSNMFLQGQAAYVIPISGDQYYAGDVFHYHLSLNKVLWCAANKNVQLVGTCEFNGWNFLDGAYTNANLLSPAKEDGSVIVNMDGSIDKFPTALNARDRFISAGPGLRLVICDKIDFGAGTAFGIGGDGLIDNFYRAEFRWRF